MKKLNNIVEYAMTTEISSENLASQIRYLRRGDGGASQPATPSFDYLPAQRANNPPWNRVRCYNSPFVPDRSTDPGDNTVLSKALVIGLFHEVK